MTGQNILRVNTFANHFSLSPPEKIDARFAATPSKTYRQSHTTVSNRTSPSSTATPIHNSRLFAVYRLPKTSPANWSRALQAIGLALRSSLTDQIMIIAGTREPDASNGTHSKGSTLPTHAMHSPTAESIQFTRQTYLSSCAVAKPLNSAQ